MEILSAYGVSRSYVVGRSWGGEKRTLQALREVDLEIAPGEAVGIVGESGCGKSTLARLLLGIEEPTAGAVSLGGRTIDSYDRLQRAALIQPIFQDPYSSLNPRMTIGAIIAAPLEVQGRGSKAERRARVLALMEKVGLAAHLVNAYPGALSGGQRQRVAIARALICEPKILVCDEPTSALDVSVQSQILNLLQRLGQELQLTIILISHNLAVINHLTDRVCVMYLGSVVEEASTEALFAEPRHPYTKTLLAAALLPRPGARLPELKVGTEFPSPLNPPSGCAFHPRCPKAFDRCRVEAPALRRKSGKVACHLYE